jgi:hypothetical protein
MQKSYQYHSTDVSKTWYVLGFYGESWTNSVSLGTVILIKDILYNNPFRDVSVMIKIV